MLRSIVANCGDPVLADRLDQSISGATDIAALTRRARHAVTTESDLDEERTRRRQLADLVSATRGRSLPGGQAGGEAAAGSTRLPMSAGTSLAPDHWFPPARSPWHRRRRRLSRRQGVLGLVIVLVLLGAVWTAPRMWSELRRGWDTVLNPVKTEEQNQIRPVSPPPPEPVGDQPAPAPNTVGTAPAPVEVGAPGSAGPITLVTATPANGECRAGGSCVIRVDVHLDPATSVGAVTWALTVYDRCSGQVRTNGDVSQPVQSGTHQVYGIGRTDLPPGTALAVAAITSAPATAASEPLLVPSENAVC
ncbi:hypothetical protein [Rhodococcus tukisamuensis]|nr:hypothetical protein [Rhodococcus tukisamuensis]